MRLHYGLSIALLVCACSESRRPSTPVPTNDGGVSTTDGSVAVDAAVEVQCDEPPPDRSIELIASSFIHASVIDESRDLMVGIPRHLDSAIHSLTAVSLVTDEERTVSLRVDADIPLVQVIDARYDRAAQRSVILAYEQTRPGDGSIGPRLQLLALEIDEGHVARLVRLEPTTPPNVMGPSFSRIFPEGDGVHYRAFRYESSARATVSGDTVSWEAEVALTRDAFSDGNQIAYDPAGGRIMTFGEFIVEGSPPDFTERFVPSVLALSLAGGTHWSRVPAGGDAPPEFETLNGPIVGHQLFFDEIEQRLVVLMDHEVPDPFDETMTYYVTGAWALANGAWSVINEDLGFCCAQGFHNVPDHQRQRLLFAGHRGLTGTNFAPGMVGQSVATMNELTPAPALVATAFDGTIGAIIGVTRDGVTMMNVRAGDFAWRPMLVPNVARPSESVDNFQFVVDGSRLISIGGSRSAGNETTAAVYVLDRAAEEPSWALATTTGPAHDGHVLAGSFHDVRAGVVYVAGGKDSRSVSALDLSTMAWRKLADLPTPRPYAKVRVQDQSTIEVAFGSIGENSVAAMDGFEISLTSGVVTPFTFTGGLPNLEANGLTVAPLSCGWLALASGERLTLLEERDRTFVRRELDRDPRSAWSRTIVVDPTTGSAYAVGKNVWRFY